MFSLFRVELIAVDDGRLPTTNGHLLHGVIFNHVKAIDPAYSSWLHEGNGEKPFALAPLRRQRKQADRLGTCAVGDFFTFQIGVCEEALAHCIPRAFQAGTEVHVGELTFLSTKVTCAQRWDPKIKTLTPDVHDGFVIRFLEPTAFRSQGVTRLFPEPRLLIGSLAQK